MRTPKQHARNLAGDQFPALPHAGSRLLRCRRLQMSCMLTSMAGRGLSTMAWIFVERSPRLTPIDFASPFRAADAKGFHCPPSARRGHASRRRVPLRRHLHPSSICQSLAQISVRIVPCRVAIVGSSYPLQNSRRERRLQCDALRPAAIFCSQITFRISARRPEMSPALVMKPRPTCRWRFPLCLRPQELAGHLQMARCRRLPHRTWKGVHR